MAAVTAKQVKEEVKPAVKAEAPPKAKPAVNVAAAKPVVKAKPAAKPAGQQLSASEKALLEWPTSGYTLQVLGAGLKKSADDFIRGRKSRRSFTSSVRLIRVIHGT
ncbi:hypothetical protein [Aliamphritea spongicola]|nr:hypothetical protein [Aliamphritea spongicola]